MKKEPKYLKNTWDNSEARLKLILKTNFLKINYFLIFLLLNGCTEKQKLTRLPAPTKDEVMLVGSEPMSLLQAVEIYKNSPELQNMGDFSIELIEKSKLALCYVQLERKKGKNPTLLGAYRSIIKLKLDTTQMDLIRAELKSLTVQINRQAVAELPSIVR